MSFHLYRIVVTISMAATMSLAAGLSKGHTPSFADSRGRVGRTSVTIRQNKWYLNEKITYRGAQAEGLLMNVRMVNAVFEDQERADYDTAANTDRFVRRIPDYVKHGVRAFTLSLQGGMPGYEGAVNSALRPDGSLRPSYLERVRRVIESCDRHGAVVILGCYYQRQDQIVSDQDAVRAGVANVARWVHHGGFKNVVLEIANEFGHPGFDHRSLNSAPDQAELISLAKNTAPGLLVSTSGLGDGRLPNEVARASDFLLIHLNTTKLEDIGARIGELQKYGKPIVCNEDDKIGADGARAAQICVDHGASWGFMHKDLNQSMPFTFAGSADSPDVYAKLKHMATADDYFPPPESQGGWRTLHQPDDVRTLAGMDPDRLNELKRWLLKSDERDFAAVVIRNGYVALEVERGNSAKTDSRRVASVSKAVCATVLAIASDHSQKGKTPKRMVFDDPAFDFIPWARPLSDPRKANITIKQLLNHTSGICPESTRAKNNGTWKYILGHSGDPNTARLAFDPGTACGYSTHALDHAALVCETVTGVRYDEFAVNALFRPIGCEHWWFHYNPADAEYGKHPWHSMGMPARDLARIAYCMLRGGRWRDRQIIPSWFVDETATPTHSVTTPELRFKRSAQSFSHGWELSARLTSENGPSGEGIPIDARYKPGSGGQLIAFVPSLGLVIVRQTGVSGSWEYEEYLRRACQTVLPID